jgi:transcriptional regulator with PAS, ATPase and Fis domain
MATHSEIMSLLGPLLSPLSEGVLVCDASGNILMANQALYHVFSIMEVPVSLSLTNLNGHNLRISLIRAGLNHGGTENILCESPVRFEEQLEFANGPRWFSIESCLLDLPDSTEKLRMVIVKDISAEKRLTAVIASKEDCCFLTEDPEMLRLLERLDRIAGSDASVLFQGESGTGKTELARHIHQRSKRADKPFVEVNCGAIPASLIETELFGHIKGAFTGAIKDRPGRFKAADGGTMFLDEINELPKELQPKLLRVLQDGEYEAVGSDITQKVNVRIVSASNKDLTDLVDDGAFRDDLYYRIAVIPFFVPPLRERPGDIPMLVEALKQRLEERGYSKSISFSAEAMRPIMNYPWPGNVRELANVVEHSVICAVDGTVYEESLPDSLSQYCRARRNTEAQEKTAAIDEKGRIIDALQHANGNKTLAAQMLKIDRSTLWRKMQRLGIE